MESSTVTAPLPAAIHLKRILVPIDFSAPSQQALVKTGRVEGWSLAAEPAIHRRIVDLLPVRIRERIVEHVPSDLLKTAPAKLPLHFRSLQPRRSSRAAAEQTPLRKGRTSARTAKL